MVKKLGNIRYYKSDIIKYISGRRSHSVITGFEMWFYTYGENYRDIKHTVKTVAGLKRFFKKVGAKEVIL